MSSSGQKGLQERGRNRVKNESVVVRGTPVFESCVHDEGKAKKSKSKGCSVTGILCAAAAVVFQSPGFSCEGSGQFGQESKSGTRACALCFEGPVYFLAHSRMIFRCKRRWLVVVV